MEIRAKLSLAVDGFKSGLDSAKRNLDSLGKKSKAVDDYIAKSGKDSSATRRVYAEKSANGQISQIRKVEKVAIDSSKRIDSAYKGIKPGALPLPIVQKSARSTVKLTSDTEGLPQRKTAEYRYELEVKISNLKKAAAEAERKAAESALKMALTAAEYKKRGYKSGAPKGMEETVLNLFGKDLAKDQAKLTASIEKEQVKTDAIRARYHQRELDRIQKQLDKAMKAEAKRTKAAEKKQSFAAEVKFLGSEDFMRTAAATRYALYDVGQRFIAFGTIVVGALASAVKASADMESSFTSVERTVGLTLGKSSGAAEELRAKLIDLSTTIPVSFDQIAKIATLGAQMGISSDAVDNFAETVSKFSAITGISAETAAQSFGRLGQLLDVSASEFENLSSAITYTGVNSVATDQEILNMSESIAAAGKQAGFSADEVVGLSAALASLKVRPEEARGVLARLFREIDIQVSTASTGLDDFAQVLGVSSESAANLWKQDPSGFFAKFLDGAQATGKLNETLVALGITNTREMNVIQRLSQNTDLMAQTMADAEKQFLMGTYSSQAYGLVVDDLNSKITIFQSTLTKMQASFGDVMSEAVKGVVDILTGLANVLSNMPSGIKWVIAAMSLFAAVAAVAFGSLAIGIAGLLAMKLAMRNLTKEVGTAGISLTTFNALLTTMIPTTGRAAAALKFLGINAATSSAGVNTLKFSLRSLMIASGIGIAIVALSVAFDALNASANKTDAAATEAGKALIEAGGGADAFAKAIAADQEAIKNGAVALGELTVAYDESTAARLEAENAAYATGKGAQTAIEAYSEELDATGELTGALGAAKDAQDEYNKIKSEGVGISKETTLGLGAETAKLFIEGLSAYKGPGGDQATFWEEYLKPDNAKLKAEAEALGFDFGRFAAAALSSEDGAAAYMAGIKAKADALQTELLNVRNKGTDATNQVIQSYGEKAKWSQAAIDALKASVAETGILDPAGLVGDPAMFNNLIAGADGFRDAMKQNEAVITANKNALIAMGYEADAAAGISGGLSEELQGYMDAAFSGEKATNAAADALGNYLEGINDTKDGMAGARQDSANWISFMEAAQEAAVLNGEGFAGSVKRIAAGIGALKKAGKSTKEPFEKMRTYLVNAAKGEGFTELGAKIATATSPEEMQAFITAWTNVGIETNKSKTEVENYGNALIGALTVTPAEIDDAAAGIDKVAKSAGQAKTALELMQEALEKVFKTTTNKMAFQDAIDNLKSSLISGGKSFSVYSEAGRENLGNLQSVIDALAVSSNGNKQTMANDLLELRKAMVRAGITSSAALGMIDAALRSTGKTGKASTKDITSIFEQLTGSIKKESNKTKKSLKGWVSDIGSVLSEALQNRYDSTSNLDKITSSWDDMKEAAAGAAEKIQDAKDTIATMTADKNVLEYQLKIAVKYGDTLRANTLRAAIAEKNAGIASETQKQADAQAEASTELKGNTKAAINNRAKMRDLVEGYNEYLLSLARTGASNEELNKKAKELAADFLTQGKNMGFAEEDLKSYTEAFEGDFATVIKNLPRDVTLSLNSTDPVIAAIADFVTKANAELANIEVVDLSGKVITGTDTGAQVASPDSILPKKPTQAEIDGYRWAKRVILNKKLPAATRTMAFKRVREFKALYGTGYKDGGLVLGAGSGTSDSIPAMLSNREFVINAAAVKHYGVDFMNSLNQMRTTRPYTPTSAASSGNAGSGVVYLSPEDRQLLRAAIDRPIALYTENQKIAQSANAGNVLLAQRGIK